MKHFLVILGLVCSFQLFGQTDPAVMEIDGKKVTKSEFLQIYLKNNPNPKYDAASMDEYMELFTKFKLKVAEAEALGYDTVPKLKRELEGYRKTLATPYLVDHETNDELVKQAYERSKKEIKASHILILVKENASPADTLRAYTKIAALKKRIEKGEDFETVAKGPGGSEDPSVANNGGDLGYFTAFQMVYQFEEAAYNTPVGKISNIVRTKFGYHILKVIDERPARGTMTAAHIMLAFGNEDGDVERDIIEKKIIGIYDRLVAGENFDELVNLYSEDPGSNNKGGVLPDFGTGTSTRMVPEFEAAAFELKKDGEFSKPVKTQYGWHIIKRISWKPLAEFSDSKKELQNKVNRDERSKITQDSFVAKLKKEYKFKDLSKKNLTWFTKNLDSTYLVGTWKADKLTSDKPLFTIDGKSYGQQQFANYLIKNFRSSPKGSNAEIVATQYKNFQKSEIIALEESKLEAKYPEFKALMQEYHDGILLYEIMTEKVWNKASKDTLGLKAFYESHKSNYTWGNRIDAFVYEVYNKDIANQVYKMLQNDTINSKHVLDKINKESDLNLKVRTNKFEVEQTDFLKGRTFKKGLNPIYEINGKFYIVKVSEIIPSSPKALDEAKGIITSDYQVELEKEWIESLKAKHPIKIYTEVLYNLNK